MRTQDGSFRPPACCAATWGFGKLAVQAAIPLLNSGKSALDAIEAGIRALELDTQDQYFVGRGGYPNAKGIMELDAAIMDHLCRYGAVMSLCDIANPISVARSVMEECPHNILTGEGALEWALSHNFQKESLLTPNVEEEWKTWLSTQTIINKADIHDTIGFICLDQHGHLAAGSSTSGWKFKWPGRVGDAPVIGSGLYCDGTVGAAVATGDGEEILRVCLSFLVVEYMRMGVGKTVQEACSLGIQRLLSLTRSSNLDSMYKDHQLVVGVIAIDKDGNIGAASTLDAENLHRNHPFFPVSYWREGQEQAEEVKTLEASKEGAMI